MAERLSEKFEIRPWQEGDDLALLEIWNSARNEVEERQRGLFGPDTDAPFSRTLVVTVSGVPVAAGTVVASFCIRRVCGRMLRWRLITAVRVLVPRC